MKYILTLLCLVSFVAYGQEPAYTPMRLSYQFRTIKVDSLFLIPSFNDTTAANNSTMKNVAGAMIRTGNDFWMRNATTNAWLQNVNVGTGASPSIQFVDSVWRVAGKDSIFWRKGGTTNKIKDSAGLADSPDRIDGTATNAVVSSLAGYDFDINSVRAFTLQSTTAQHTHTDYSLTSGQIYLDGGGTKGLSIYLDTNLMRVNRGNKSMLTLDTLGNVSAGDLTKDSLTIVLNNTTDKITFRTPKAMEWSDPVTTFKSQVKTAYKKTGITLSGGNDTAYVPGTYIIDNAATNSFYLPDATKYPGQTIYVVNRDDTNTGTIDALAGSVLSADDATYSLKTNSFNTFTSDGADWWGAWHQP